MVTRETLNRHSVTLNRHSCNRDF